MDAKKYKELYDTPPVAEESAQTQEAREQVKSWEEKIPTEEYKGTYSEQVGKLVSDYLGRDKFNYNPNSDATYQQMRDTHFTAGKKAMQDTLGNATALSGGNNNSSAQVAAQQVYNNYAKGVTDAIPQLEQNAYNRYQAEGAQKLQDINLLQGLDDSEFAQYQGKMQNIQAFLNYYYRKYQGEQARDEANFQNAFVEWQTKLNAGQTDYWNQQNMEYQKGRDEVANNQSNQTLLMNNGWQKLQAGVVPNEKELLALNMTPSEANQIIANIKSQNITKGGVVVTENSKENSKNKVAEATTAFSDKVSEVGFKKAYEWFDKEYNGASDSEKEQIVANYRYNNKIDVNGDSIGKYDTDDWEHRTGGGRYTK